MIISQRCSRKLLSPTYYRDKSKCPQRLLTTMCCNDRSIYNANNIHEIISNNNYNSQERTNEGISNRIDHAKIINNDNYTQQLVNNNKISNITNNVKINNNNYFQYTVINRYGNREAYNILNNSEYFSNSCIQHSVTLSILMYGSGSVFNITKAITSRYKTFQVFDTQTELYNVKYTFNYYKKCMKM